MSSNASFYQIRHGNDNSNSKANGSTATLRPRTNRLISYEDGGDQREYEDVSDPPPVSARGLSPSNAFRHQTGGHGRAAAVRESSSHKRTASDVLGPGRRASGGVWESWSSISGMASSFLAGDVAGVNTVRRASSTNTKRGARMLQDKGYTFKQAQSAWGPTGEAEPQPKSIEEQRALLQAKRREILLAQGIAIQAGKDSLGRFKRKDSNASMRSPIEPTALEHDVLVYRHRVQPHDTMAGVVIKYSCQPEAFRKINRFWPNDNIQRKTWVVLPIDACAIKGRRTESAYIRELDTSSRDMSSAPSASEGLARADAFPDVDHSNSKDLTGFKHDSWVMLPSFDQPVEILRISKKDLGYFPPARRKSPDGSTNYTPFSDSNSSTPRTSFDTLRHPPTHAAQQAQLTQLKNSLSPTNSPVRQPSLPRLLSTTRSRSSSTISTTNGTGSNAFLSALTGPGGVGTLRGLRTERARPGPADDPLNKKFAQYFPEQLPPDHPDYDPSKLHPAHARGNSLRVTPRASMESTRSTRSNSSSFAGWMGKVASSPMRKKNDLRLDRGDLALSMDRAGDLIELSNTPDEVSRQLHDAIGEPASTVAPSLGLAQVDEAVSVEENDTLNKNFPIRGRVMRAYEHD